MMKERRGKERKGEERKGRQGGKSTRSYRHKGCH